MSSGIFRFFFFHEAAHSDWSDSSLFFSPPDSSNVRTPPAIEEKTWYKLYNLYPSL